MEKMLGLMKSLQSPKDLLKMLFNEPIELNIKIYGIKPDKQGINRLWIGIALPSEPEIPQELEQIEEKETNQ